MRMWVKDDKLVNGIINLNHDAFKGIEQAPSGIVRAVILDDETAIFAVSDGELHGAAIVTEKFDEPYIWSVAVRRESRGKGICGALLTEVADYAREKKADGTVLIVNNRNVPAQRVYLATGYRVIKFLPRYYAGDGDGLLMRRKI